MCYMFIDISGEGEKNLLIISGFAGMVVILSPMNIIAYYEDTLDDGEP